MTQSDRPTDTKTPCIINDRKLDYLFNVNIKPDAHNSKRAVQNREQLHRLGFDDDSESRQFIQTHLEKTVQEESNIVNRFSESYINNSTGEEGEIDTELEIRFYQAEPENSPKSKVHGKSCPMELAAFSVL